MTSRRRSADTAARPANGACRLRCALLAAVSLVMSGCGRAPADKYPVRGAVTYAGEPISEGHISLVPTDGSLVPDCAFFTSGGYYLLARPGEKRVEIRASRVSEPAVLGVSTEKRQSIIPAKYNSESVLEIIVGPTDENHFDFRLDE